MVLNTNTSDKEKTRKLADDIALQIMGMKPRYIKVEDIPKKELDEEIEKIKKSLGDKVKGKSEEIMKNIINGKLR